MRGIEQSPLLTTLSLLSMLGAVGVGGCGRLEYGARVDGGVSMDASERDAGIGPADGGGDAPRDAPIAPDAPEAADAAACSESPCRLVAPQCGCPADRMCQRTVAGTTTRGCVAPGVGAPGDGCALSTDCEPGSGCLAAVPGAGQCLRWCLESASCAPEECARVVTGTDVGLCTSSCDPLGTGGSACPSGLACRLVPSARLEDLTAVLVAICSPEGGASELGACTTSLDCAPGLYCDGSSVCRRICRDDADCGGAACALLSPPFRGLGLCS